MAKTEKVNSPASERTNFNRPLINSKENEPLYIRRHNFQIERANNDQLVVDYIISQLDPNTSFIIKEKNPIEGQPDLDVTISDLQIETNNKIFFKRSDSKELQSRSYRSFCLNTQLVKRGPKECLVENTEVISKHIKK